MKPNLLIIIICFLSQIAIAQEQQQEPATGKFPQYPKFKLTTHPMQLCFQNINLTAERVFEKRTVGLTLGYKPALQDAGRITTATGLFDEYRNDNIINQAYNAATIGINSKAYFHPKERKDIYVDAQLLYRYWWFDNKNLSYPNVEGYRFEGTRTEHMNVYNAKILFGYSAVGRMSKKTKLVADFSAGLDIRYKTLEYTTYNGTVMGEYHSYLKETDRYWIASPYIGIEVGIAR